MRVLGFASTVACFGRINPETLHTESVVRLGVHGHRRNQVLLASRPAAPAAYLRRSNYPNIVCNNLRIRGSPIENSGFLIQKLPSN
jgi:hypothetical protein